MIIPDGTYKGIAMPGAAIVEMGGKEHVLIQFKLTQGELAGEVAPWKGWLTPAAMERTLSSLRALGWGGRIDDLSGLDNEVDVVIKKNEYKGKATAEVAFVNAPRKPADASKLAALQARIDELAIKKAAGGDPFADPE